MKFRNRQRLTGLACLLSASAVLLSSCAGSRGGAKGDGGLLNARAEGGLLNAAGGPGRSVASGGSESLNGEVLGVQLQNRDFDLPVEVTPEVLSWMEYFTTNGRRHFNVYLERKARMEPIILPRLKEAGLPQDLIYLAMIESGFSTAATSHAGAVGPWQFIRSTGRLFGLQADWWIDQRRDPVRSTEAAIGYLSRLHAEFGDWRLACSAYNSGELRIRRAISRLNTRDYWTIARDRRALMRETRDYVPKMMAAAIIGKNPEQYGFRVHRADDVLTRYETVKIPRAENLRTIARVAGIDRDELMQLNPELLRCCTPPQRGSYTIRVPKGDSARLVASAIEAGEIGRFADFRRHVIRRGDSLSTIARHNGVPVEALLAMNEIRSVKALKPGTELVVPERGARPAPSRSLASVKASVRAPVAQAKKGQKSVTHVVKQGDTLYAISRRYAVRVEDVRRWNAINRAKNLRPGSRIKLYVRNESSEAI